MKNIQTSERTKTVLISVLVTLGILLVFCVISKIGHHKMSKHDMHRGGAEHTCGTKDTTDHSKMNMSDDKKSMGMAEMMHDMNASLRGKSGDEFDKIFLEEMIIHHQGAVDMAELALQDAGHQEIKDLSRAIIDAQKIEISQMKDWLETWYK